MEHFLGVVSDHFLDVHQEPEAVLSDLSWSTREGLLLKMSSLLKLFSDLAFFLCSTNLDFLQVPRLLMSSMSKTLQSVMMQILQKFNV